MLLVGTTLNYEVIFLTTLWVNVVNTLTPNANIMTNFISIPSRFEQRMLCM